MAYQEDVNGWGIEPENVVEEDAGSYIWDDGEVQPASNRPEEFSGLMTKVITTSRNKYSPEKLDETTNEAIAKKKCLRVNERKEMGVPEVIKEVKIPMVYPLTPTWEENTEKMKKSADALYQDFARRQRYKNSLKRSEQLETSMQNAAVLSQTYGGGQPYNLKEPTVDFRRHTVGPSVPFDKKILTFLENGDLTDVIMNAEQIDWSDNTIRQDPKEFLKKSYDESLEELIEDQYFPGLIDDAVNKLNDFNQVAFNISYGEHGPEEDFENPTIPPSLLEAFDFRVERETGARKKLFKTSGFEENNPELNSFIKFLLESKEPKQDIIHRDEVKLANAVEIDLAASLRSGPINGLTRAILCLERAEHMNCYDKKLQAAEEAYSKAPAELAERAAIQGEKSFNATITSKNARFSGKSFRPIEIVSYIGLTEPIVSPPNFFKE